MEDKKIHELERKIMKLESMIMDIYDATVHTKKVCPACKSEIRLYLPVGEKLRYNAMCPVCRSAERHRSLWLYFENNPQLFQRTENKPLKILHFAPEKVFYDKFSKDASLDYYPVDADPRCSRIRKCVDMTDIPYEDNIFDVIICNHVLEHIRDERKALQELYRVLKPGGTAFINVLIFDNLETTIESPDYNTPELRIKYYGQDNHVRAYGGDYVNRLEANGFHVEVIQPHLQYSEEKLRGYAVNKNEKIFKCNK